MHLRLRHARRVDLPAIAALWTEAFASDPFLLWMAGGPANWSSFGPAWMTFIVELTFERGHTYVADPPHIAVAWVPPDIALVGPDDIGRGRDVIAANAGEARADDAVATIVAARGAAIDGSHWTLQYIGVQPGHAGSGLGTSAVAPMLTVCDAEAMPCGLVSTNPRNRPFYERLGFEVAGEIATPDGAASLTPMHRLAR